MRISIDVDKCIASGVCVLASPDVFAQDEDGFVILLNDSPDEALEPSVTEAAAICPAMVITVATDQ